MRNLDNIVRDIQISISTRNPYLVLSGQKLTDEEISVLLPHFQNNTDILYLYLNENSLTKIPKLDLPNLIELGIMVNNLKEISNLENIPKLRLLLLSNNNITKLDNLKNLPVLEQIFIGKNNISSVGDNIYLPEVTYIGNINIHKADKTKLTSFCPKLVQ